MRPDFRRRLHGAVLLIMRGEKHRGRQIPHAKPLAVAGLHRPCANENDARHKPDITTSGGWGIRTPEGLHPTRFPSVRHRPLGESSRYLVNLQKAAPTILHIYRPGEKFSGRDFAIGDTPQTARVCSDRIEPSGQSGSDCNS